MSAFPLSLDSTQAALGDGSAANAGGPYSIEISPALRWVPAVTRGGSTARVWQAGDGAMALAGCAARDIVVACGVPRLPCADCVGWTSVGGLSPLRRPARIRPRSSWGALGSRRDSHMLHRRSTPSARLRSPPWSVGRH